MTIQSNETVGRKGARIAIVVYTVHGHIASREFDIWIGFPSLIADPVS